jgi:hypothetical protein
LSRDSHRVVQCLGNDIVNADDRESAIEGILVDLKPAGDAWEAVSLGSRTLVAALSNDMMTGTGHRPISTFLRHSPVRR